MDAAHASFAPDKAVMLIDPTDGASTSFWREHNPEALAMAEGTCLSPLTHCLLASTFPVTAHCERTTDMHESLFHVQFFYSSQASMPLASAADCMPILLCNSL